MLANLLIFLAGCIAGPAFLLWLIKRFPGKSKSTRPVSPSRDELIAGVEHLRDRMRLIGEASHQTGVAKLAQDAERHAERVLSGQEHEDA